MLREKCCLSQHQDRGEEPTEGEGLTEVEVQGVEGEELVEEFGHARSQFFLILEMASMGTLC